MVSFTVAKVRRSGTTPPQEVIYSGTLANNPGVQAELTLMPDLTSPMGLASGPLSLTLREQGGAHYDLKDESDSLCAIL